MQATMAAECDLIGTVTTPPPHQATLGVLPGHHPRSRQLACQTAQAACETCALHCRLMQSTMEAQYDSMGSVTTPPPQQAAFGPHAAFGDAASMQRQMLAWQMQQLRPVKPAQLQLAYHSHDNPVAHFQDAPSNPMVSNFEPSVSLLRICKAEWAPMLFSCSMICEDARRTPAG